MSRLLVEPVQLTQWDTASLDSNLSMTAEQRAEVAARWSELDARSPDESIAETTYTGLLQDEDVA